MWARGKTDAIRTTLSSQKSSRKLPRGEGVEVSSKAASPAEEVLVEKGHSAHSGVHDTLEVSSARKDPPCATRALDSAGGGGPSPGVPSIGISPPAPQIGAGADVPLSSSLDHIMRRKSKSTTKV